MACYVNPVPTFNLTQHLSPTNFRPAKATMGSIQLLMTALQQPQPTLQSPQPTLPHRFLSSHSTGRPVDYPLLEVTALSNLMRWHPRLQYRCADNLKWSIWRKQIAASWNNCKQPPTSHLIQPTSTSQPAWGSQLADSRLARGPGYCTAAGTIAGCLHQRHAYHGSSTHAVTHPGRNSTCQVCWSPS
jgi:hypothetical protein